MLYRVLYMVLYRVFYRVFYSVLYSVLYRVLYRVLYMVGVRMCYTGCYTGCFNSIQSYSMISTADCNTRIEMVEGSHDKSKHHRTKEQYWFMKGFKYK